MARQGVWQGRGCGKAVGVASSYRVSLASPGMLEQSPNNPEQRETWLEGTMVAAATGNSLLTLSDPAGDEVSAGDTVEAGLHLSTHRCRAGCGRLGGALAGPAGRDSPWASLVLPGEGRQLNPTQCSVCLWGHTAATPWPHLCLGAIQQLPPGLTCAWGAIQQLPPGLTCAWGPYSSYPLASPVPGGPYSSYPLASPVPGGPYSSYPLASPVPGGPYSSYPLASPVPGGPYSRILLHGCRPPVKR